MLLRTVNGYGGNAPERIAEVLLDAGQGGHGVSFEAQHHRGRGVRRPRQAEAVGVIDAHAIQVVDGQRARELAAGAQRFDPLELLALGGFQLDFGGGAGLRQAPRSADGLGHPALLREAIRILKLEDKARFYQASTSERYELDALHFLG